MAVVSTVPVNAVVTDADGNTLPVTASFNISVSDVLTEVSFTFSPDPAPTGTMRTATLVVTSSAEEPLTAVISATFNGNPIVFTPVTPPVPPAGAPAGSTTFQWTFTV